MGELQQRRGDRGDEGLLASKSNIAVEHAVKPGLASVRAEQAVKPGLASVQAPAIDLQSIAQNIVVSATSLPTHYIADLRSQYGNVDELMIARSGGLPTGVADYLGDWTASCDDKNKTVECRVYRSHKGVQHLDVFLTENAALGSRDRSQILLSLKESGLICSVTNKRNMICSSNYLGEFQESELHILPDQQVVDLTQFDLSVASEFDQSNAMLLKSAFRLCVVSISRPTVNSMSSSRKLGSSDEDDASNRLHASRVLDIASQCHVNNVGFIYIS